MKFEDLRYCSSLTRFQENCRRELGTNPDFTLKALEKIWNKQTQTEKMLNETIEKNGVGFDAFSAKKLSSIAKKIELGNKPDEIEMMKIGRELKKYLEQLFLIVHNRI